MKRTWSEDELREYWSLSTEKLALFTRKTSRGQLGFAVLLKYFQLETRFPPDRRDIPPAVIDSLVWQLGTTPETFEDYDWHDHTGRLHRRSIREWLGFRTPTADDAARLVTWRLLASMAIHIHCVCAFCYTKLAIASASPSRRCMMTLCVQVTGWPWRCSGRGVKHWTRTPRTTGV